VALESRYLGGAPGTTGAGPHRSREKDASACIRGHQAFALAPVAAPRHSRPSKHLSYPTFQ